MYIHVLLKSSCLCQLSQLRSQSSSHFCVQVTRPSVVSWDYPKTSIQASNMCINPACAHPNWLTMTVILLIRSCLTKIYSELPSSQPSWSINIIIFHVCYPLNILTYGTCISSQFWSLHDTLTARIVTTWLIFMTTTPGVTVIWH